MPWTVLVRASHSPAKFTDVLPSSYSTSAAFGALDLLKTLFFLGFCTRMAHCWLSSFPFSPLTVFFPASLAVFSCCSNGSFSLFQFCRARCWLSCFYSSQFSVERISFLLLTPNAISLLMTPNICIFNPNLFLVHLEPSVNC